MDWRGVSWITVIIAAGGVTAAFGADSVQNEHPTSGNADDPYLWLEDIHGAKPLAWVHEQNAKSRAVLQADPDYQKDYDAILKVLDATDRIPYGELERGYVLNFWQDAAHPKGIWRRTSVVDYAEPSPQWELLLDLDKLAAEEHQNWVWGAPDCSPALKRCLLSLSRGGGDAVIVREFDLASKSFVKDGFALEEAKSSITYLDEDTVLLGTDFGNGSDDDLRLPAHREAVEARRADGAGADAVRGQDRGRRGTADRFPRPRGHGRGDSARRDVLHH